VAELDEEPAAEPMGAPATPSMGLDAPSSLSSSSAAAAASASAMAAQGTSAPSGRAARPKVTSTAEPANLTALEQKFPTTCTTAVVSTRTEAGAGRAAAARPGEAARVLVTWRDEEEDPPREETEAKSAGAEPRAPVEPHRGDGCASSVTGIGASAGGSAVTNRTTTPPLRRVRGALPERLVEAEPAAGDGVPGAPPGPGIASEARARAELPGAFLRPYWLLSGSTSSARVVHSVEAASPLLAAARCRPRVSERTPRAAWRPETTDRREAEAASTWSRAAARDGGREEGPARGVGGPEDGLLSDAAVGATALPAVVATALPAVA